MSNDKAGRKGVLAGIFSSREKQISEQLDPYIFDEAKIFRKVPFAQFLTGESHLAVGVLLHKERESENGELRQVTQPAILTSEPKLHVIFGGQNRALRVRFESVPPDLPKRYSLAVVPQLLYKSRFSRPARELFDQIKAAYEEYLFFRPDWYAVHACWDLATYFFMLFPAFPYLELRGPKGAAKTKVMRLSRCFTFNASDILTSPTESSLFRIVHDQRPSLYIDEAENLFQFRKGKIEHDARVEVINSGYHAEGWVPRMETRGKKFFPVYYSTYCPKMLASIKGLYGATESRAIVHSMIRAKDSDPRGEREVDRHDERWAALRDELFFFMFGQFREVLQHYEALGDGTGLKKRDLELWRPLLAVARLCGSDVEEILLRVAAHQQELSRIDEYGEDAWERLILERAWNLLRGGQTILLYKELAEAVPEERRPSSKRVGRLLDDLGFRDFPRPRTRDGVGIEFQNQDDFSEIAQSLVPDIFTSPSSPTSHTHESEGFTESQIELGVKEREGEQLLVKEEEPGKTQNDCEGNEGNEESEADKDTYFSASDLFAALSKLPEPQPYEELERLFPGEPVEEWLADLKQRGDVYEPRAGYWKVLE